MLYIIFIIMANMATLFITPIRKLEELSKLYKINMYLLARKKEHKTSYKEQKSYMRLGSEKATRATNAWTRDLIINPAIRIHSITVAFPLDRSP
jgi:hypothetical protein